MLQTLQGETYGEVRRDVTESASGKVAFGRDVMLQTVQGGRWSLKRDLIL